MAERRMFSKKIIDEDNFIDMPTSTRLLYFDLCMRADDDGFITPKKILRMTGASEDDLNVLIARQFVLPFETGVIVIKHWKIHNYIQKDRYNETVFLDEKDSLDITKKEYVYKLDTKCIQDVSKVVTQVRLGKDRLGKVRKEKEVCSDLLQSVEPPAINSNYKIQLNDKSFYDILDEDISKWQELYPSVNVISEIKKMIGWCDANPSKRKTRRGVKAFINNWLAREQDKGGKLNAGFKTTGASKTNNAKTDNPSGSWNEQTFG